MLEQEMLKLRQGNRSALANIYNETKDAVFSLCYSYMRIYALAEDMMQETYMNVIKHIGRYKESGTAKAWITTIARNLCLNELKKRKREVALPDETLLVSDYTVKAHDESGIIELTTKILRKTESSIVLMHTVGGIPLKEIAELLKIPYATVRWQYANAIKKLRKEIEGRGEYD